MNKPRPPIPADERLDNPVGYYRYGDEPETTPRPQRLHSHGVELGNGGGPVGALGGPPFSRDFAAYLPDVPTAVERAEFARTHWWSNPYWRRRVRAQFEARFGKEQGKLRYSVALRLASGYQDTETLKVALKRTSYWIHHQREIAESFAQIALFHAVLATAPATRLTKTKPAPQRVLPADQTYN